MPAVGGLIHRAHRANRRRRMGLGRRIALALAMAMVPVALVLVVLASILLEREVAGQREDLTNEVVAALSDQRQALERSYGFLEAFGGIPGLELQQICTALSAEQETLVRRPILLLGQDGPLCNPDLPALGAQEKAVLRQQSRLLGQEASLVVLPTAWQDTGRLALVFSTDLGEEDGPVIALLPLARMWEQRLGGLVEDGPLNRVGLVNREGQATALAGQALPRATTPNHFASLVARVPFLPSGQPVISRGEAIVPLFRRDLFVVAQWPPLGVWDLRGRNLWMIVGLPVGMWLAMVLIAWIMVQVTAVRPILQVRRIARAYVSGDYRRRVGDTSLYAQEIGDLLEDMEDLADAILEREAATQETMARQKQMLTERATLLKEVYHRVKNNLQVILSMIRLQSGRLQDRATQEVLGKVEAKVLGMALVHQHLYQSKDLASLQTKTFLGELISALAAGHQPKDRSIPLSVHLDNVEISTDTAIPLALYASEVLINGFKHGARATQPSLSIQLSVNTAREAQFKVTNSMPPAPEGQAGPVANGFGETLIRAFAKQLGGEHHASRTAETYCTILTVTLPEVGGESGL